MLLDVWFRSSLHSKSFTKSGPAEKVWVDPMFTNTSAFTTMLRPKIIPNLYYYARVNGSTSLWPSQTCFLEAQVPSLIFWELPFLWL